MLAASPAAAQTTNNGTPPPNGSAPAGLSAEAKAEAAQLLQQAQASFDKKKWKDASTEALKVLKIDDDNLEARYIAGISQRRLGWNKSAKHHLAIVRAKQPDRKGVARALAEALEGTKDSRDLKAAAKAYLDAANEERSKELFLKAGEIGFDANEFKISATGFKNAGELAQPDLEKYATAAEKAGRFAEAHGAYDQLATKTKESKWRLADASLYLREREAALKEKDEATAKKSLDGADRVTQEVIKAEPTNGDALLVAADIAKAKGDAKAEEAYITGAIKAQPQHPTANRRLAKLLQNRGDLEGAKKSYQAQLAISSKDGASHLGLGEIALAQKDPKTAAAEALLALEQGGNAKDPAANLVLGRAEFQLGNYKEAVGPLTIGTKGSDNKDDLLDLAQANFETGSDSAASRLIERVQEDDKANPRSHEIAGMIALKKGKRQLAQTEFTYALAGHPNDPDFFVKVAGVYLSNSEAQNAESLLDQALTIKADHPGASRMKAGILVGRGEFNKALPLLETSNKANPNDVEVLTALGQAYRAASKAQAPAPIAGKDGKPDPKAPAPAPTLTPEQALAKADEYTQAALKLDAKSPAANETAGLLLVDKAGKDPAAVAAAKKAAIPSLEKSLAGKPGAEALAILGKARRDAGDVKGARELLKRVKEAPVPAEIATLEAALDFDEKKYAEAEDTISPVLLAHPENGEASLVGGEIAFARGALKDAKTRFDAAEGKATFSGRQFGRYAAALASEGQFPKAKTTAEAALKAGFDEGSVHATLGWAIYKIGDKQGEKPTAKEASKAELDIALKKGANDKTTRLILGEIAYAEAQAATEAKDVAGAKAKEDEALGHFNEALKLDKESTPANSAVGRILADRKQYADALPKLKTAYNANPEEPKVALALAKTYLALGNYTTNAEAIINGLPEGSVDQAQLHLLRAQIAQQRGNYMKAAKEFDEALKVKPNDAEILQAQGQNFLKLPQYDNAIKAMEKALAADPNRGEIAQNLAKLYAETGAKDKAAQAQQKADAIADKEREAARRNIPPDQLKVVAVTEEFKQISASDKAASSEFAYLGKILPDGISRDLAKSPYIQLLTRDEKTLAEIEKQKEQWAIDHPDATPEDVEKAMGELQKTAPFVVDGQYVVIPGQAGEDAQVQVTAKLVEVKGAKVVRSSARNGTLKEFDRIQHAVALELLGQFVPISEKERKQIEDAIPTGNLESMRLLAEAADAQKRGDFRTATGLLKQARAADEGNVAAIEALKKAQAQLGQKNRVAVRDFTKVGEAPSYIETGLQASITSKLANIEGIQVVEREQLPAIEKELELWAVQNEDKLTNGTEEEQKKLQDEADKMRKALPVGALVSGQYQVLNGVVVIDAKLTDVDTKANLLAERVSGPEKEILDLQNKLAEKIARRLVGAPSEDEMKRLREKQDYEAYKRDMQELARRRAEEKKEAERKEAEKLAAVLPKPKVEIKVKTDIKSKDDESSSVTGDNFWVKGRYLLISSGTHPAGLDFGLYGRSVQYRTFNVQATWVVGTASNRWGPGRNYETPVSLYDTGLDVDVNFRWKGIGLAAGATATVGMAQSLGTTTESGQGREVNNSLFLGIRPRVGAVLGYKGLRFTGDVGFQLARTGLPEGVGLSGLFLQGGISYQYGQQKSLPKGFELEYRSHLVMPNGVNAFNNYGGIFGKSGGFLLGHQFLIGGRNSSATTQSFVLGYMSRNYNIEAQDPLKLWELGYDFKWNAYSKEHFLNPFIGGRLSVLIAQGGSGVGITSAAGGVLGAGRVGVDAHLFKHLNVQTALGYDAVALSKGGGKANDIGGFAVDLGATLHF
jgi:tetratricopeptide (TPR) repeat protein